MAITRHVYIYEDVEVNLKKVENISSLINNLLREHFKQINLDTLSLEDISKQKKILEAEIEAMEKIEAIQNGS